MWEPGSTPTSSYGTSATTVSIRREFRAGRPNCATVCVMSEHSTRARVGVRELRQNLSIYLDRVKDGETLEVTEHGRPVAELAPLPAADLSPYERMVAHGRIRPATGRLADLGMPPPIELPPGSKTVSETLLEMREEERW